MTQKRRPLSVPARRNALRLALEPRIVFDGAMPVAAADAVEDHAEPHAAPVAQPVIGPVIGPLIGPVIGPVTASALPAAPAEQVHLHTPTDARAIVTRDADRTAAAGTSEPLASTAATADAPAATEPASVQIAFVDAAVQDIEAFLPGFTGEIITLRADQDGVAQMAQALAGRTGVSAIHIVSHGEAGRLALGSGTLDAASIGSTHAADLAAVKAALTQQGDILLYGCDVAAGATGQAFIEQLAQATGSDVAASTDSTGAAARGGDWVLESSVGSVEAGSLEASGWEGTLSQTSTGTWTTSGTGNATTASNTTSGVTATVSFGSFTNQAAVGTFATSGATGTLNNIAVFSPAVQNTASLGFVFSWDSTPDATNTNEASIDAGTGVMTITFSQAVLNPVIHLDRIGGTVGGVQNGMRFTLVNPGGLSLTGLSGTPHFAVDTGAGTIQNSQVDAATGGGYSGTSESSTTANLGSAAGSVQINGTVTSVQFLMSAAPNSNEGAGGDGVELKLTYDPVPIATADTFSTPHDVATTIAVRTNDSDAGNDALTVTKINGTAVTAGGAAVAVTGGTAALDTAGNILYTPTAAYVGGASFNYTIADPAGSESTATVTGNVTDAAPVVDFNSGSTSTERVTNGGFTGGATGWTTTGTGTAGGTSYYWSSGNSAGTLTQSGITGWDNGFGANGAAQITFGLGWNNGTPDNAVPSTLDISVAGVVYARFTTNRDAANGTQGSFTYLNGATGSVAAATSSTYLGWTYSPMTINLPSNVAASGNLVFSFASPGAGTEDDIAIDNVSVLTRTDTVAGNNYSTAYTENAAPIAIAAATSEVRDGDNATITSATVVLANAQAGDLLSVIGSLPAGITASAYNAGTGTLTLSGGATLANYATAIRSIGFSSTSDSPSTTARTVNVTVNDGFVNSATSTTTITVTATNDAPVAANDSFSIAEDSGPVTITVRANDVDPDGDALTVTQVNGTAIAVGGSGIDVTGGVVTLNASGNLAFTPTAHYNGSPSFTYTVADPSGATSTATVNGTVTAVNDAPVVNLRDNTNLLLDGNFDNTLQPNINANNLVGTSYGAFTSSTTFNVVRVDGSAYAAGPVAANSGVQYIDLASSGTLSQAFTLSSTQTLSFGASFANRDVNTGGYAAPSTVVEILNGSGTVVATATALSLSKANGKEGWFSTTGSATLAAGNYTFRVTMGDFSHVDSVFVRSGNNYATAYTENGVPVAIASTGNAVTDVDNTDMVSATIVISNVQAGDLLSVVGSLPAGITASAYNAGTGTITLSGTATSANYAAAIRSIGFSNTGENPSTTARTLNVTVNDGTSNSNTAVTTITVTAVNDAPVTANDSYSVNEDTPLSFDPRSNDTDAEGNALTITQINGTAITADSIGVAVTGGVIVRNNSGTLTFVPNLNFSGNSTFSYTVSDGNGGTSTSNVSITVNPVNDAPALDLNGPTTATTALVSDGALDASAPTNAWEVLLYGGTFAVAGTGAPNDTDRTQAGTAGAPLLRGEVYLGQDDTPLVFRDNGIAAGELAQNVLIRSGNLYGGTYTANATNGDFNPASGSIYQYVARRTMTDAGTLVLGQAGSAIDDFAEIFVNGTRVAQNLNFTYNLGAPLTASFNAGDVVEIRLSNQGGTAAFSVDARIYNVNHATTYTENGAPVSIAATNATVSDVDNANLTGATVTLTNFQAGDLLSVTGALPIGITASAYNAGTGVLTLSGSATAADYQTAIRQIGFSSGSDNPSTATRLINTTVTDGSTTSRTAVTSITVTAVNDAPVAANDSFSIAEDSGPVTLDVRANDTDAEGGTLTVTQVNGNAITAGGAGVNVTGGVVTLNVAGNLVFTPTANYNGSPSFTYTVADPGGATSTATVNGTVTPVNDAPVAVNDSFTMAEDGGSATINVRGNDSDVEGDAITVTQVNGTAITAGGASVAVSGGSVALDLSGNLVFTPTANYNGSPSFTYTVADPGGATATATVNGTVTPVNDAPTSVAPAMVAFNEDTTTAFVGASALSVADADGTALTVTLAVDHGTLTLGTITGLAFSGGDGTADAAMTFSGTQAQINAALASLTFTPVADFNGTATLNFDTSDGTLTSSKSVMLVVAPVVDAVGETVSTNEDAALTMNVLSGTGGASADNFENVGRIVTAVTQGAHGSVTFAADGTMTYTPLANYAGSDSFVYTVTSGGVVELGTVTVDVVPLNDAPTLTAPVSVTLSEDSSFVFAGASALSVADVDSGTLTVTISVTNGTLTLGLTSGGIAFSVGDGTADPVMTFTGSPTQLNAALATLSFVPFTDYHGGSLLSFATGDGTLNTSTVIGLTITPVVDVVDDTVATSEDTPVSFNVLTGTNGASADNFEGSGRSITAVTQGAHGSVSFAADGTLTYTPAANYSGSDTFTYTVSSGGATEVGTVTVNIASLDDAPVTTAPASVSVAEDTVLTFSGANAMTVADVDNPTLTVTLSVTNGTLTLGTITGLGFASGDGTADSTMSFSGTQAQLNAALASLSFAPTADFHGAAALSFSTSDGTTTTSKAVAITVNPVVDIVADSITTAEDTPVTFNVLTGTNGASADNFENAGQAVTAVTQGAHGSVSFAANGTFTYTPAANYYGNDSFSYTVTSGGVTETTTVTMTVSAVNDAPIAQNDSFTVAEDNPATIAVLANDSDVEGDALTVTQVNGSAITAGGAGVAVAGGIVTLDTSGRLLFTPNANYNGSPSFTYTVADASGAATTATVSGTVSAVNDAPVALADAGTSTEDAGTTGSVLANDTDGDADTLTVSAVAGVPGNVAVAVAGNNGGLFTVLADGSYSFASNGQFEDLGAGQTRSTSVSYEVSDGNGGSATATLTVTVSGVNDAPTAVADSFDTVDTAGSPDGTPLAGSVLLNDADAEHATLTVSAVNGSGASVGNPLAGVYGTLTLNADGSFSYAVDRSNPTVAALLRGDPALTETFTYTTSDGAGGQTSTTLTILINGTNDSPYAGNDTNSMAQGEASASGNVLTGVRTTGDGTTTTVGGATDSDPNGDPISVNEIRLPGELTGAVVVPGVLGSPGIPGSKTGSYGTVTIYADGSYTYVLDNASAAVQALLPGQQATDTFIYSITDGASAVDATITIVIGGSNDAPLAVADSFTTAEDTPVSIDVRGNDSDPDSDPFTVTQVNGQAISVGGGGVAVSGGTVTLDLSGRLLFAPTANYNGNTSFTYTIADPSGATATATVSGTVSAVNDAPVAGNDSFTIAEDNVATIPVGGNDSDVDGDTLTVTQVAGQAITAGGASVLVGGGSVALTLGGDLVFTPDANFNGSTSFSYVVTDPNGASSTATVSGTVTPVNDAPVANADSFSIAEDTPATIAVRANDSDVDGDLLTVTLVNGQAITAGGAGVVVTGGIVTLDLSGRLVFTPTANYNGAPSFSYTVADPGGASATTTVSGTVSAVNDTPVAANDSFTVAEDTPITIDARGNDSDADGDTITVIQIDGQAITAGGPAIVVSGGSVALNLAGNLVFTPGANYHGAAGFSYTVADPGGATSTASVSGTVTSVNDVPVAANDSFSVAEDNSVTIDVRANDGDVDGDLLTVTQVNGTAITAGGASVAVTGGSVALDGSGRLVFTPAANYNGSPSFSYTVADPSGATSTATASGTVTPVNDAPVAAGDSFTVAEDNAVTIDVRANDSDADGDAFSVTQVNGSAIFAGGAAVAVTGGSVWLDLAGRLTFMPSANYHGAPSFTYTVADSSGATSTATVSGTVTSVNDAPVALNDSFIVAEDTVATIDVKANDSDVDGDALTVTQVGGQAISAGGAGVAVTGGVVTLDLSGRLVFTPTVNFNGAPSFTYTVTDPSGASTTATVSGTVNAVNDAPVASPDTFTVAEDGSVVIDVLANDGDVDGDPVSLILVDGQSITQGSPGVVVTGGVVTLDGSNRLVFTPTPNLNGAVGFSYTIGDASGASSTASVGGTVTAVNDAPVAAADSFTIAEDNVATIDVRGNDSDVDGDSLTVTQVNGSAITAGGAGIAVTGGVVTLDLGGNLVFTPTANFNGLTNFTYTVADPSGATSNATVNGTVTAVNDAPSAGADAFTTTEDTPSIINVRANDTDPEGDTLTVTQVNGQAIAFGGPGVAVTGGVVTLDGNGDLVFTPTANFNGSPSFSYTVSDASGATATATVGGTVTAVNDAPVAANDSFTIAEDTPATINVRTNDTDAEGDALTVTQVNGSAIVSGGPGVAVTGGVVTLNGAGNLVFTPAADYNGPTSFTYTVADPSGAVSTATVNGSISAVNDAPAVVNDNFLVDEDTPATLDVRANDGDVDGDAFAVTQVNGQAITSGGAGIAVTGGVVTLNGAGNLVFTPTANFSGNTSFTYTVADGGGATSTATVNGTVNPLNDAPVAVNDSFTTAEDTATTIAVRGNDSDADGDALVVTLVEGQAITTGGPGVAVTGGVVTLNGAGNLVFTPSANYNGSPSFTYTVADPSGATSTATVNGTVTAINDIPVAAADSFTTAEDTPATIDVRANDTDGDGDTLTVTQVNGQAVTAGGGGINVTGGVVTLDLGGSLVFTPTANYAGASIFSYTVADAAGATAVATVTGSVTAVNDAPIASIDSFTTPEDNPAVIDVRANDSDAEGDTLTVTQVNGSAITAGGPGVAVTGGVVTLNTSGNLVYTPNANYNGSPSFTYTVSDGQGGATTATVNGTVTAVNDVPVASNDSATVTEAATTTGNTLANDSDADTDPLTVTAVNGSGANVAVAIAGNNGGLFTVQADGSYTFTPNGQFEDLGAGQSRTTSLTYTVADGQGGVATATLTVTVTGLNDAPVAVADSFNTVDTAGIPGGTPFAGTVLLNDTDAEGAALVVTEVNGLGASVGTPIAGTYGTLTLNADGSFSYAVDRSNPTVVALLRGQAPLTETFTYTASDGSATSTAGLSIVINGTNDSPEAGNDTNDLQQGESGVSGNVITGDRTNGAGATSTVVAARDTDANLDPLAVNEIRLPGETTGAAVTGTPGTRTGQYGTITMNADGSYAYVLDNASPAVLALVPGQQVTETFIYTVTDGASSVDATITVIIGGTNDAPTAANDANTTLETAATTGNVLSNDTDPDTGQTLGVTDVGGASGNVNNGVAGSTGGVFTVQADGSYSFDPSGNFQDLGAGQTRVTSVTYGISDGNGGVASATLSVTVTGVNDAPVAALDNFTASEDTPLTFDVRGNDVDVDSGDTLNVTLIDGQAISIGGPGIAVTGGVVTLNGAGNVVFTPNANYHGAASFSYTVADAAGLTSTATANGSVLSVNDAPVAAADSFTIAEDTTATILVRANDSDADGDPLIVTQVNGSALSIGSPGVAVTGGVVTLDGAGHLVFTANANFNGPTSFSYTVADLSGATSAATVTGTITPVADAPLAVNDSFIVAEDTAATIAVRGNDSDADGDTLTVTQVDGQAITAGGPGIAVTGGVVTLDVSGQLVFTPAANYVGASSFSYTVSDPSGALATAAVNGTVTPVNDAPAAGADSFAATEDTPVTFDVRSNDTDLDGDALTVTQIDGQPIALGGPGVAVTGGVVTLNGAGQLVFTPAANFNGPTSFSYTVADPSGATSTATVSGSVAAVNDVPVAQVDTATTVSNTPVTIDVLGNDSDAEGALNPASVQIAGTAQPGDALVVAGQGTWSINPATGAITFTPIAGFLGTASTIDYSVADAQGLRSNAVPLSVTVALANSAPAAGGDSFTTAEDTPVGIAVLANDSDANADALRVTQINGSAITAGGPGVAVAGGVVTLDNSGNLVFTPSADFNGAPSFTYTVADPLGASTTATVSGTVTPVNDAPVAAGESFTIAEDTPAVIAVRGNDSDEDGDALTVTQINGSPIATGGPGVAVTGGVVTLDAAGRLVFTPVADFNGAMSFSYTVADASGAASTATVNGTITPANDAPVAASDSFTTNEDAPITLAVRGNDSDADGDTLTVTQINGVAIAAGGPGLAVTGGVVTLDAAGELVFTPAANTNGPASFTYTVADASGAASTARVSGTVTAVDDAPVARADTVAMSGNTPVVIDVLANDSDVEGDALTITAVNGHALVAGGPGVIVAGGVVTLDADGRLRYTPDPADERDERSFTYTTRDPSGAIGTATVTIVRDVQAPPPQIDTRSVPWIIAKPPIATEPAAFVLASVGETRGELSLAGSVGSMPVDAVTSAEIGHGLSDDLSFVAGTPLGRPGLIGRDTDLTREGALNASDTLFVQHAVRHEGFRESHALFVQGAVRSSQLEAKVLELRATAMNSAAPGTSTLLDPFALEGPGLSAAFMLASAEDAGDVFEVAGPDVRSPGDPRAGRAAAHADAAAATGADALAATEIETAAETSSAAGPALQRPAAAVRGGAPGFAAQLQRNAADFRARSQRLSAAPAGQPNVGTERAPTPSSATAATPPSSTTIAAR